MSWCLYIFLIYRSTKNRVLYYSHLFLTYKSDNSWQDSTVQVLFPFKKNNYISVLFCFFDAMVSLFLSLKQMSLVKVNGKCNQAAKKPQHLIDSSSTEGSLCNLWVCFLVQSCADEVSSFHHGTKIYSLKKRGKM